jgi:hypothetical protein
LAYTPDQATLTLYAGFMSRIAEPDKLSMQFVHASAGLDPATVRLAPGFSGAVQFQVTSKWKVGAIAPFPPYQKFAVNELGDFDDVELFVYGPTSAGAVAAHRFEEIFGASGMSPSEAKDGSGLVFVALGASPAVPEGEWHEPFRWLAVPADP